MAEARQYWMLVYNETGGLFRVVVTANSPYDATQMIKGMYGSKCYSQNASQV